MNYYILVEGERVEPEVYRAWIKYTNPKLKPVDYISDFQSDNYYIFSGGGYPNYFDRIIEACKTVQITRNIDTLVIAIDSEDMTYNDKKNEIQNIIQPYSDQIQIKIIIQHFCIETWALGNSKILKRNPQNVELCQYLRIHDVNYFDPEFLPAYPNKSMNRAQFAYKYLRKMLNERHLVYSKSNPKILCSKSYYKQIKKRCLNKEHIQSFHSFLKAFL